MTNPLEELRETKLFKSLLRDSPRTAAQAEKLVEGLAPILASTIRHFPYYTRHDAHHGYQVIKRIYDFVRPECFMLGDPLLFSPPEQFLLIASAYAHDLGMTVFPGEEDDLLKKLGIPKASGWETDPKLQAHLRAEHSRRGGAYIEANATALGIPVPLVSPLDKMMRAHNLSITELEQELSPPYVAEGKLIDMRQLAAILCIADALEFSDTRVIDGVIDRIVLDPDPAARQSYLENMKHVCVGGSLAVEAYGAVVVSGTFHDDQVLALAHRTFDEIEGWVQGYCDVDRRSKQQRILVRPIPFERNLAFTGGRFERLGVRLNRKSVIDLIASNAVWRDSQGIAVRELIQNAVEACRFRAHHSSAADSYVPKVRVVFDRHGHTVSVLDNGCGMSERTILKNFLTVGSSRSREPGYSDTGYAPIARFGVGFWSVFTIAETAQIETAEFESCRGDPKAALTADGFAFEVSLHDLKEYTVFRPLVRACGTTVRLQLRPGVIIDEVFTVASAGLLCSEIPVTFYLDGTETQIPMRLPSIETRDVLGERTRVMHDHDIRIFKWRGEADGVEVALGLAYRMHDGKATFLLDQQSSIMNVIGFMRYPRTSICGFSAPIITRGICIDLSRVGIFFANRISPAGIEYALDRSALRTTTALMKTAHSVRDLLHIGYRAFLDHTNSNDTATVTNLRSQAAMHGGNVYDNFTGKELATAAESYPDLVSVCLHPVEIDKEFDEKNTIYADLNALRRMQGKVFVLQTQPEVPADKESSRFFLDLEQKSTISKMHAIVRKWIATGRFGGPAYIAPPDRVSSMLFDADPDSTIGFAQVGSAIFCIQFADLAQMSFDKPPSNILAEVQGRWSGAIYDRIFERPDGKPYLFLGRHRVIAKRGSRLAGHIADLAKGHRMIAIADLVASLQEDQSGFTPKAIEHLL